MQGPKENGTFLLFFGKLQRLYRLFVLAAVFILKNEEKATESTKAERRMVIMLIEVHFIRIFHGMIPLSSNSQSLKVVLAVVVLFLGWLIASMIPRSEAPWDKTSSSFLARRPVTGADGELSVENSEYQRLWSQDKENWDPEKRSVTIDYDSDFFGQKDEETAKTDGEDASESSDDLQNEERVQRWSDEIKVENDAIPEITVDERPKWEDDSIFDAPVADPQELAPPMSPLGAEWEEGETSSSSETAEEGSQESSQDADSVAAAEEGEAAVDHSEESAVEEESLIVQAGTTADSENADSPAETDPAPILSEPNSEESVSLAADEPKPLPTAAQPEVQSAISAGSPDDGRFPFPTQRPAEQIAETSNPAPQTDDATPLPMNTLTPSSGTQAATVESLAPAAEEGLISQVTATLPNEASAQYSRSAYYQEPVRSSVSSPMAVSIYTAGPGENWDGIAAKFGLSAEEAARYYDVNSFRINSDRTVTEGMKLMLPKR